MLGPYPPYTKKQNRKLRENLDLYWIIKSGENGKSEWNIAALYSFIMNCILTEFLNSWPKNNLTRTQKLWLNNVAWRSMFSVQVLVAWLLTALSKGPSNLFRSTNLMRIWFHDVVGKQCMTASVSKSVIHATTDAHILRIGAASVETIV